MTRILHGLSFDVEEYFHVANLRGRFERDDWEDVPSRLAIGMDRILDLLEAREVKATFFFLGWVAERFPELVIAVLRLAVEETSNQRGVYTYEAS